MRFKKKKLLIFVNEQGTTTKKAHKLAPLAIVCHNGRWHHSIKRTDSIRKRKRLERKRELLRMCDVRHTSFAFFFFLEECREVTF